MEMTEEIDRWRVGIKVKLKVNSFNKYYYFHPHSHLQHSAQILLHPFSKNYSPLISNSTIFAVFTLMLIIVSFSSSPSSTHAFNIDSIHPLVILKGSHHSSNSLFGFAATVHRTNGRDWVVIGAPDYLNDTENISMNNPQPTKVLTHYQQHRNSFRHTQDSHNSTQNSHKFESDIQYSKCGKGAIFKCDISSFYSSSYRDEYNNFHSKQLQTRQLQSKLTSSLTSSIPIEKCSRINTISRRDGMQEDTSHQWFGSSLVNSGPTLLKKLLVNEEKNENSNFSSSPHETYVQSVKDDSFVLVCAPRYVSFSVNNRRREPVGTCFTISNNFNQVEEYSPCRTDAWGRFRLGYCQAGFSVSVSTHSKRLFIAAPGSWNGQGQMFSQSTKLSSYQKKGRKGEIIHSAPTIHEQTEKLSKSNKFRSGRMNVVYSSLLKTQMSKIIPNFKDKMNYHDDEYFGYSQALIRLTISPSQNRSMEFLLVGVPRGDNLKGEVVMLHSKNMQLIRKFGHISKTSLESDERSLGRNHQQCCSYFGHSIAVGDFNGDSHQDFVATAPIFSPSSKQFMKHSSKFEPKLAPNNEGGDRKWWKSQSTEHTNESGRIYIYYNQLVTRRISRGWNVNDEETPLSTVQAQFDDEIYQYRDNPTSNYGRFGFSVISGDLDEDGVDDLVVGSPYANSGSGMVAVYMGQKNIGLTREPTQLLDGGRYNLKTFGFSLFFHKSLLYVGSPKSDSLIVFKSKRSISLNVTMTKGKKILENKSKTCVLDNGDEVPCFSIDICFTMTIVGGIYHDNEKSWMKSGGRDINVLLVFELDTLKSDVKMDPTKSENSQRIYFVQSSPSSHPHPYSSSFKQSRRLRLRENMMQRVQLLIFYKLPLHDYKTPIHITLSYELADEKDKQIYIIRSPELNRKRRNSSLSTSLSIHPYQLLYDNDDLNTITTFEKYSNLLKNIELRSTHESHIYTLGSKEVMRFPYVIHFSKNGDESIGKSTTETKNAKLSIWHMHFSELATGGTALWWFSFQLKDVFNFVRVEYTTDNLTIQCGIEGKEMNVVFSEANNASGPDGEDDMKNIICSFHGTSLLVDFEEIRFTIVVSVKDKVVSDSEVFIQSEIFGRNITVDESRDRNDELSSRKSVKHVVQFESKFDLKISGISLPEVLFLNNSESSTLKKRSECEESSNHGTKNMCGSNLDGERRRKRRLLIDDNDRKQSGSPANDRELFDQRRHIVHVYQVQNVGPSDIVSANVTLVWPVSSNDMLASDNSIHHHFQMNPVSSGFASCDRQEMTLVTPHLKSLAKIPPQNSFKFARVSNCRIGPLSGSDSILFRFEHMFDMSSYMNDVVSDGFPDENRHFLISSFLSVQELRSQLNEDFLKGDSLHHRISTQIILPRDVYIGRRFKHWYSMFHSWRNFLYVVRLVPYIVWILAILVALFLLLLMFYILHRIGFFKRSKLFYRQSINDSSDLNNVATRLVMRPRTSERMPDASEYNHTLQLLETKNYM